uniref:Reverse transcriptase domain-containing protein n=1 Tax=Peronospora matthiolae TaxID=2874970 RepID=A0AAV1UX75_9STRA
MEHWTAHWMAATAILDDREFTIINVYAPVLMSEREKLFQSLEHVVSSVDSPVFLCCNLYCTLLDSRDRSYTSRWNSHDPPALRRLLDCGGLTDVLDDDIDDHDSDIDWRVKHHTYFYTMPGGREASCRLDRWYCSAVDGEWVRVIGTSIPGPFSDHNGVSIRVAVPGRTVQVKSRRQLYPPPRYAVREYELMTTDFFQRASGTLEGVIATADTVTEQARATAIWWDAEKAGLRQRYSDAAKDARRKSTTGYRQRLKRLTARLATAIRETPGPGADPSQSVIQARRAVVDCKAKWQKMKRRSLFRSHAHHPARSQKKFYRRVSTKFVDNTVYSLRGPTGLGHHRARDLAQDMREGWRAIMQQTPPDKAIVTDFLDSLPPRDHGPDLSVLSDELTAAEVLTSIRRCKRGKAWGPDSLNNDWYRDNEAYLVPLLTRVFNVCALGGILPGTFGQAVVACIKKSRSAASPLDYRPISLLNSDYKVFTRIYASRLRPLLPTLVNPLQTGFVPRREMATVLDIFAAAKLCACNDPELHRSLMLLLDFSKAYDSLSRNFLLAVMSRLGFPASFVHLTSALHMGTRSQFIVNGYMSDPLDVGCGIRQGCPLAPLLFIIAVEPLYEILHSTVKGVRIANTSETLEIKVCGYAYDTAVYVQSPEEVSVVMRTLMRFGAASGLVINASKSVAVPLCAGVSIDPTLLHGFKLLQAGESQTKDKHGQEPSSISLGFNHSQGHVSRETLVAYP